MEMGIVHCAKKLYFILAVKFAIRQKSWIWERKKHSSASLSNQLFVNRDRMNIRIRWIDIKETTNYVEVKSFHKINPQYQSKAHEAWIPWVAKK